MLSLDGIFSYFPTSKPSAQDLEECENVLSLTPSGPWDPHTKVYAQNERNMTDHEGNMIEEKHRVQILLSDIQEDVSLNNEHQISDVEARMVDTNFEGIDLTPEPSEHKTIDVYQLEALMAMQNADAQFMKSIGSTTVCKDEFPLDSLLNEDIDQTMSDQDTMDDSESEDTQSMSTIPHSIMDLDPENEDELDAYMECSAHTDRPKGT